MWDAFLQILQVFLSLAILSYVTCIVDGQNDKAEKEEEDKLEKRMRKN